MRGQQVTLAIASCWTYDDGRYGWRAHDKIGRLRRSGSTLSAEYTRAQKAAKYATLCNVPSPISRTRAIPIWGGFSSLLKDA
jgi:hypothetical protein